MANLQYGNRAVVVPAGAGSGKTFRIAHEYILDVLRDRYDDEGKPYFDRSIYKQILAVTFTNKATEEMKSRILKEIHLLASGSESEHLANLIRDTHLDERTLRNRAKIVRSLILHDYSHFTILTNDTFFQRILRAFIRELGIDFNFTTELDTAPVLSKSVEALINDITENNELRHWLEELTEERISDGEKWDIRHAITTLSGELFKESSREIITNIKDKNALKQSISSFSQIVKKRKIALQEKGEEALRLIESRGFSHDDFKSKFTKFFDKVADGSLDKVTDTVLGHITDSPEAWFNKGKATPELISLALELQALLADIYREHIDLKTLENTQRILTRNYRGFALLHDLQSKVEDICREENSMLLSETKHAIAGFISEAEAPFIYEKIGNYYQKFMIDEFQDTSSKEWGNFLPLLRNSMSQSEEPSVLIVGDVKQSIYRWRGGDWRILGSQVERDLGACDKKPLTDNWRSLPNIVEFNNQLFDTIAKSENERLNALLDQAKAAKRISDKCKEELYDTFKQAYADHEQTPRRRHSNKGYINISASYKAYSGEPLVDGRSGELLYIERIKELLSKGYLPRDITILVRKNSESVEIAKELLDARDSGVFPEEHRFEITTEEALNLSASPATKLIVAIMRLATNRDDTASLTLYNHLHKGDCFSATLSEEEHRFLDSIRLMSPEEAFEHIIIRYDEDLQQQTAYVQTLHEHIVRFCAGKVADLALFDKWWREKGSSLSVRVERSDRAIEIMTIHKAKGLENKVVIIPRCSWALEPVDSGFVSNIIWAEPTQNEYLDNIGAFPISFNRSVGESLFADGFFREMVYTSIDAINMLYVAFTRAKEQLHIFINNRKRSNIDTLLLDIYEEKMSDNEKGLFRYYELGTYDGPEPTSATSKRGSTTTLLDDYYASPVNLKLRTDITKYFEEEQGSLSPRDIGIRLHRIFENASTGEEILANINQMVIDGALSQQEASSLREQIDNALNHNIVKSWFDDSWEQYNERNIIRPNNSAKRPDRVMIRNKEAIVVDYKFGAERTAHRNQITDYMTELRQMGYSSVDGFLWYVSMGKIVRIGESGVEILTI